MLYLLTKRDVWSEQACKLGQAFFRDQLHTFCAADRDPLPELPSTTANDMVLSFLCPWVLPKHFIERPKFALNFHPGSAGYPGIGCYNFALYDGAATYGAVCHYMEEKVDTGRILFEETFAVSPDETVETLKLRTRVAMLALFHRILGVISRGEAFPESTKPWSKQPTRLKDLVELRTILPEMDEEEVRRRVRATTYPGQPAPELVQGSSRIAFPVPNRLPLA